MNLNSIPPETRSIPEQSSFHAITQNSKIEDLAVQPLFKLKTETSWLGRWVEWVQDQMQWSSKDSWDSFRSFFYESEYEILASTAQNDQYVRATKSWIFTSDREKIYALSPSLWKIPYNFVKQFYMEGLIFSRTAPQNALQVSKIAPSVLLEEATKIHKNFFNKLSDLKTAYEKELSGNHGVLSEKAAHKLYKSLKKLFSETQRNASQMDVHGQFEIIVDSLLDAVEVYYRNPRRFNERLHNRVDEVKSTLERFLQVTFDYAGELKYFAQASTLPKTPMDFSFFFEQLESNTSFLDREFGVLKDLVESFRALN